MRTPNHYRTGFDPGESGVREWIDLWAEDSSDITIRAFNIECPNTTVTPGILDDPLLLSARRRRDSELHSFLKFLGARWLRESAGASAKQRRSIRYEAQMYFPSLEALEVAERFRVRLPAAVYRTRILTPRDRTMIATYGHIIAVDVLAGGTSVEAGATQPFNLLSPLLEGLTRRAVWIPFPPGANRAQFRIVANPYTSVTAYEFTQRNSVAVDPNLQLAGSERT